MPHGTNFTSDELMNFLIKVLDSDPECFVLVDQEAKIIWLNKAYQNYLDVKLYKVQGRPVVEVIPNTRLHVVVKTGIAEIGEFQEIYGRNAIVNRIPLFRGEEIIGAIGKVIYKTDKEFKELVAKISSLEKEVSFYKREITEKHTAKWRFDDILTCSPRLRHLKEFAYKIAAVDVNVMILSESGCGKELFAHSIHATSKRSSKPFV
ncbi:MAG: sigma 54-interacting transcriptional regulator, partial [Peptococcaceae bacterium]|nr:sigma 54-interacting transcriptional regulator [Peptococcaceae bacterium]